MSQPVTSVGDALLFGESQSRLALAPGNPNEPLLIPRLDTGVFERAQAEVDGSRVRFREPRLSPADFDRRLVSIFDPQGAARLDYEHLADRILAAAAGRQQVVVTAAAPGAGRTTTALNVGLVLAGERRVTVVDLDLWNPGVGGAFGLPRTQGLTTLLRSRRRDPRAPIDLVSITQGLSILPAGPAVDSRSAERLLAMPELDRVLAELACVSDLVLIDAPPVLAEGAREAILRLAGLVLVVVSPNGIAEREYSRVEAALPRAELIGAVVNGVAAEAAA